MRDSAKANVCVYFLRDPRDMTARYVGITHQPRRRFYFHWQHRFSQKHFTDSNPGTKKRQDWYRELDDLGLMPVMDVVLTGLTRDQAKRAESYISQEAESAFPGKMYQIPVGLYDPLRVVKDAWLKSNQRQRQMISDFISQQLQPT